MAKKSTKDVRICVLLDDDVDKKLRTLQSKMILKNKSSVSFSKVINEALKNSLKNSR